RAGLHQPDAVTDAGGVALVMRLDLAGPADDLAVEGVLDPVLHRHNDRLVHLVRHHEALADLAEAARLLGGRGLRPRAGRVTHAAPSSSIGAADSPSSRSRMTVYTRAMSCRTVRSRRLLSSCPVAIWKRRLKSSSFDSRRRSTSSSFV